MEPTNGAGGAPEQALTALEDGLLHAREIYDAGDETGRQSALRALIAVLQFIESNQQWRELQLSWPLGQLGLALSGTRYGVKHPMIRPPAFNCRHNDTTDRKIVKAAAAGTAQWLKLLCGMTLKSARHAVAKRLDKGGFRQQKKRRVTHETIRTWERDLNKREADDPDVALYQNFLDDRIVGMISAMAPPEPGELAGLKEEYLTALDRIVVNCKHPMP